MNLQRAGAQWLRRAQPLLGTLVEIGVRDQGAAGHAAIDAAFAEVREVQACLSRFDPDSDVARFNDLGPCESFPMRAPTRRVLEAARELRYASAGAFDITLGSAPFGWDCADGRLHKRSAAARLDLGGIGKGHAVDAAVEQLIALGMVAGWVNAGGDLRAFGTADVPVRIRDERAGGVRAFARVRDGAFATSRYGPLSRSHLASGTQPAPCAHVSVAAPLCLWADALTKVVALSGDTAHPLLARFEAQAWRH